MQAKFLAVLLLAAVVAGCTEMQPSAAPSTTSPSATSAPEALVLSVDALAPTREAIVTLQGTVSQAARVSAASAAQDVTAGAWTLDIPLDPGQTTLVVTADTGEQTQRASVIAVRLVAATFEARYTMAAPPHPTDRAEVWYDPDGMASAFLYEGTGTTHPPHATVHDLMVTWEVQESKTVTYSHSEAFGFGVERIEGVGQPLTASAPPYWCYKLNGSSPDLGITLQAISPGDVVVWEYAGCA